MNHPSGAIHWVDSPAEFVATCAKLSRSAVIGIDTEFVRTRTFYAQLGLIQLFDGSVCRLIDPLPVTDFTPLGELLGNPGVVKVIHSGSEDFEIFHRYLDGPLAGFFDTQIAAALSGMGASLSYQALVSELLGIDLPKGETRSNWLRRPLSQAQLTYAAHDVEYLPRIHQLLRARLESLQRSAWVEEDCARVSGPPPGPEKYARQMFRRLKFAWRLGPEQRAVALELAAWRERKARRLDRPKNWLIDDPAIHAIATALPATLQELSQCAELDEHTLRRNGTRLLAIVRDAPSKNEIPEAPPAPLERADRALVKRLSSLVKARAGQLGLAPEVLCGRRDLVSLIQKRRLSERLCGWRRAVIGDDLLRNL